MATAIGTPANGTGRPMWRLLFGMIDAPADTFKQVLARRRWWVWALPLVLVLLSLAVLTVASAPFTLELAREQAQRQLASMPAEQAEAARAMMEQSLSMPYMIIMGLVSGLIMLVLAVLAQATFLYFGTVVSGGEVEFGPVFTLSAWSRLPFVIHFLTQAGYVAFTGRIIEYQGLSFLVRSGDLLQDARNPMFALLSQVNIFWLWHLLLIVVGLAVAARFSRAKALVLVLLYAALALGLSVLPGLLFGGMAG